MYHRPPDIVAETKAAKRASTAIQQLAGCALVPIVFTGAMLATGPMAAVAVALVIAAGVLLRQLIEASTADHTQVARVHFGYQG